MLDTFRYRFTPRVMLSATAALVLLLLILPFTGDYPQLGRQMAQRYAERVQGAEKEQRSQAIAAAQAIEQGRRASEQKRHEEEARDRIAGSYDGLIAQFLDVFHRRRAPVEQMVKNLNSALETTAAAASRPAMIRQALWRCGTATSGGRIISLRAASISPCTAARSASRSPKSPWP